MCSHMLAVILLRQSSALCIIQLGHFHTFMIIDCEIEKQAVGERRERAKVDAFIYAMVLDALLDVLTIEVRVLTL